MNETWKDIYYYDYIKGEWIDNRGLYQVSNKGRVKSLGNNNNRKEKILKLEKNKKGYLSITLCKNGKKKYFRVHRLVAFMFIENDNPEHKTDVNHINEFEKDNNCVENLEWCTPQYTNNYGTHNERSAKSSGKTRSKKVIGYSLTDTKVVIFKSTQQASKFGFTHVSKCCNGKRKSDKGYKWRYINKNN